MTNQWGERVIPAMSVTLKTRCHDTTQNQYHTWLHLSIWFTGYKTNANTSLVRYWSNFFRANEKTKFKGIAWLFSPVIWKLLYVVTTLLCITQPPMVNLFVLGEAGTPRPGTPSSIHSGELPAARVRSTMHLCLTLLKSFCWF